MRRRLAVYVVSQIKTVDYNIDTTHTSFRPFLALSRRGLYNTTVVSSGNRCPGCGSQLQSSSPEVEGFIPDAVYEKFSDGWRRRVIGFRGSSVTQSPFGTETSDSGGVKQNKVRVCCQRCFRLQQYGRSTVLQDESSPVTTELRGIGLSDLLSLIPRKSVVLHIIDILNFEDSIIPEMYQRLRTESIPVISILNKVDCLPASGRLTSKEIVQWAQRLSKPLRRNMGPTGKSNVVAVSSASGSGLAQVEDLISHYISGTEKRDIYIVGSLNSGKSAFCTRLLGHVGYTHLGHVQFQRGVGGVTRSSYPGTTMRPIQFPLTKQIHLIDTPGIRITGTMLSYMRRPEDYRCLTGGKKLQPPVFSVKEGKELIIGAMARIRVRSGNSVLISPFVSPHITLHICKEPSADEFFNRKAGSFLYPPFIDRNSDHFPLNDPIFSTEWTKHRVRVFCGPSRSYDDIVVSGLGWFSVYGHGHKELELSVPQGVSIFRRPSLFPDYIRLHGMVPFSSRHAARSLKVSKLKKRITKSSRDPASKDICRQRTHHEEIRNSSTRIGSDSDAFVADDVQTTYTV